MIIVDSCVLIDDAGGVARWADRSAAQLDTWGTRGPLVINAIVYAELAAASRRYIAAYRSKTALRRDAATNRRAFLKRFALDLAAPLSGTMIFLRRSDANGNANLLGQNFTVDRH